MNVNGVLSNDNDPEGLNSKRFWSADPPGAIWSFLVMVRSFTRPIRIRRRRQHYLLPQRRCSKRHHGHRCRQGRRHELSARLGRFGGATRLQRNAGTTVRDVPGLGTPLDLFILRSRLESYLKSYPTIRPVFSLEGCLKIMGNFFLTVFYRNSIGQKKPLSDS